MSQIAGATKFIGRSDEITKLAGILEKAVKGEGQMAFIKGEAGIGKTRFLSEIRSLPIGQRFNWLTARCIYHEGTDPYLPFKDALKDWCGPTEDLEAEQLAAGGEVEREIPKKYRPEDLAKIPVIGPQLTAEPSMMFGSFMIKEPKAEFSFAVLRTLLAHGHKGMCITRVPPNQLMDLTQAEDAKVFWLSSKPGEVCIPPSLTKLSHEITVFIKDKPNSIVLLDGVEYLLSHIEFNNVLRFVNELVDSMAVNKCVLLIPINPLTMDPKHLALFERNMNTIDMTTINGPNLVDVNHVINQNNINKLSSEELQLGRNMMFETTSQQIISIAAIKPVVLFIDDLHWADASALHLLHYLARAIKNHRVAIIGAYRPEDLAGRAKMHPLQELLDRVIPEKLVTQINLDRFNSVETRDLIQSLLSNTKFPDEFYKHIQSETEGNPFFIEEVLRSLEDSSAISFDTENDSWSLMSKVPEIKLPETIKEVVHARTSRLSKDMQHILEVASILGEDFEYNILAEVTNLDEDTLVTNLDDLIRFKIIKELPTPFGQSIHYRFVHNKICEVLYKGLGESRRRLLHSKTITALEEKNKANLTQVVYELAQHSYQAGDQQRGLKYAINAGEQALTNFAPEKAKMFYQWALDFIKLGEGRHDAVDTERNIQTGILLKLSEICTMLGDWDEAIGNLKNLLNLCDEFDDRKCKAESYRNIGLIHKHRNEYIEAISALNEGLKIADSEDDDYITADLYYWLGCIFEEKGDFAEARKFYGRCMDISVNNGYYSEIADAYLGIGRVHARKGEYQVSIEAFNKAAEILEEKQDLGKLSKAYANLGASYNFIDPDKGIEYHNKAIEIADKTKNNRIKGYCLMNTAYILIERNELEAAEKNLAVALEIFEKLGERLSISSTFVNYGSIHRLRKEWDKSAEYFEKSLKICTEVDAVYNIGDVLYEYGRMFKDKGDLAEAKVRLTKSSEIFKSIQNNEMLEKVLKELDSI
jgi:predicted ATPase